MQFQKKKNSKRVDDCDYCCALDREADRVHRTIEHHWLHIESFFSGVEKAFDRHIDTVESFKAPGYRKDCDPVYVRMLALFLHDKEKEFRGRDDVPAEWF